MRIRIGSLTVNITLLSALVFYAIVCFATLVTSDAPLWARRASAPVAQVIAPSFSHCEHCGLPWKFVDEHTIWYGDDGWGYFVVCEQCWRSVSREDMMRYASKWAIKKAGDLEEFTVICGAASYQLAQRDAQQP
ncbi:MAG: hypothetical protein WC683_10100 [bacterium]